MSDQTSRPPSFTRLRRWRIGFDLTVRTLLVLAVVVMINYLGAEHFTRFFLSSQTRQQLAPRTLGIVRSLTNQVTVTLYYDKTDDYYSTILALLNEYNAVNSKITVQTVDYVRDAGAAEKIKEQYKLGGDRNLIIFDLAGRTQIVPGDPLVQKVLQQVSNEKEREFTRKPVAFGGERWFTTALLSLENPQPLNAYFLQGRGEPSLSDPEAKHGYLTFGKVLQQNYLKVMNLQLGGDQGVPDDCNLLIIAAPMDALEEPELQKIEQYLAQGGRLLALLDCQTINHPTGLETILQHWGINVLADYVKDPDHTITGQDIAVYNYSKHPIMEALAAENLQLHLVYPRPILRVDSPNPPANAPDVEELAYSSPASTLAGDVGEAPRNYPLIVAAAQKSVAGALNPRGNTRIVVAGDSFFLGNHYIEELGNRDFVNAAVNWLLDRTALVNGVEARNLTEYRVMMTRQQQREARWILLGALPGAVLLLGGLVWLARRK